MSYHEIIVAEQGGRFRVTVAPTIPLDSPDRTFDDHGRAMAFARLVRLERGFKIVEVAAAVAFKRARR